ncbi:MAG: hypothetical protein A2428_11600 [Bdellovibrionales bacterium RIFOXYC1_FULL_54_43]|nr:MAG: hypothetical protein A2428_11600 [Bdellovibrionales bacterium RIFOXYC1_FULL_54_43]OFZ82787.1 MAG: hypothetical protein A2603_04975 [Bdellovibrionales bacterium RIFOXYD1_FULL_55_31]
MSKYFGFLAIALLASSSFAASPASSLTDLPLEFGYTVGSYRSAPEDKVRIPVPRESLTEHAIAGDHLLSEGEQLYVTEFDRDYRCRFIAFPSLDDVCEVYFTYGGVNPLWKQAEVSVFSTMKNKYSENAAKLCWSQFMASETLRSAFDASAKTGFKNSCEAIWNKKKARIDSL